MAAAQESVAPFPPPPRYYEEFEPLSNKDWKPPAPPPPIVSCPQISPLEAHAVCHHSTAAEGSRPLAGIQSSFRDGAMPGPLDCEKRRDSAQQLGKRD